MTSRLRFYQVLYAFSLFPHFNENPLWVSIVSAALLAVSIASGQLNRPLLSKRFLRVGALLAPALILFQFKTMLGAEAATPLLCILVGLKLNEMREERDEMVILVLCILLVMNWLLFSQSLLTTVYMAIVLLAVGIGLMLIQSPKKTVRDMLLSSHRVLLRDIAIAVPVFLAFFFLFPRFSSPLGSFFGQDGEQTGFSDNLSPGTMANLIQSDEVAFRVLFNDKRPRQQLLYWQGKVLDNTNGWGWSHATDSSSISRRLNTPRFREIEPVGDGDQFTYDMILEPRFNQTVFALEKPLSFVIEDPRERNRIIEWENGLEAAAPLAYRLRLKGSAQPLANLNEKLTDDEKTHYLDVPIKPSEQLNALVAQIKLAGTPELMSKSVLDYFANENFTYRTTTPEMTTVEEFLFTHRIGFCEHYASAYALLMRLAGVPARVAIGYQGGEYNSFDDYLIVRDRNAHAWSEIFLEGRGWTRVDPTSVVSAGRIENGQYTTPFFGGIDRQKGFGSFLTQGISFFESINSRYILFLLDFDSNYQIELFSFGGKFKVTQTRTLRPFRPGYFSYLSCLPFSGAAKSRDLATSAVKLLLSF